MDLTGKEFQKSTHDAVLLYNDVVAVGAVLWVHFWDTSPGVHM
jgi:hypothetical protein